MNKKTLRISRENGLQLGKWFIEDGTLEVIEIPLEKSEQLTRENTTMHRNGKQHVIKNNMFVQRFFNRTWWTVIIFGLMVWGMSSYFSRILGLATIFVYALVDVIFGTIDLREEINNARKQK